RPSSSEPDLRDLDLSAPGIRDVCEPDTGRIGAVPDRAVGLDASGLKFRHERVEVPHLETHVIHRAAFCRRLRHVDLIEGNLSAGNIGSVELSALAWSRAEVLEVRLLSCPWIRHPQMNVMDMYRSQVRLFFVD